MDRDLLFVPALSGLACPHWDRRAAGLWIGLSLDTDREDMMQSLLEGVAFRAAEVIRAMSRLTEIGDEISVDGGMSVNPYFCQFLADVLGKSVAVKSFPEITAIGTAQLAGAGNIRSMDGRGPGSALSSRDGPGGPAGEIRRGRVEIRAMAEVPGRRLNFRPMNRPLPPATQ